MPFEIGSTRIFHCPVCDADTPHTVKTQKDEMYGIICTNCSSGAIVNSLDLRLYQLKWEEELQAILDSLVEHPIYDDE